MKSFVVNTSNKIEQLLNFFRQGNVEHFETILLDAGLKNYIDKLFDKEKFFQLNKFNLIDEDIINSIAHFECWKKIAKDSSLTDREFVLVCSDNIRFIDGWLPKLTTHINDFHKNSQYNLILLNSDINNVVLNDSNKSLSSVVLFGTNAYDNANCQCYLIRKSFCIKLLDKLRILPYYKFNQFSKFCEQSEICQLRELIAVVDKRKSKDDNVSSESLKNPLFSIIIPVYNIGNYLERAIKSVLSQTNKNFEIILINDGSTDYSVKICDEYYKKYYNISVLHLNINKGQGNARNLGIKSANGKYLVFLDGDDYWTNSSYLSELVEQVKDDPDALFINNKHTEIFKYKDKNVKTVVFTVVKKDIVDKYNIVFSNDYMYESILFNILLFEKIKSYKNYSSDFYSFNTKNARTLAYNIEYVQSLYNTASYCEYKILEFAGKKESKQASELSYLAHYLFKSAVFYFNKLKLSEKDKVQYAELIKGINRIPFYLVNKQGSLAENHYVFDPKVFSGKSIAIIGSADTALAEENGDYIDSFDIVIRINRGALLALEHPAYLGKKTDILCNSLGDVGGNEGGVAQIDFEKFKEIGIKSILFPYFDLHSIGKLADSLEETDFPIYHVHKKDYYNLWKDVNYFRPTSGLISIYLASLSNYKKLYISGFTFYRTGYAKGYSEAFESHEKLVGVMRNNNMHNIDIEYEWFKNFYQNNKDRVEIDKGMQAIFDAPNQ